MPNLEEQLVKLRALSNKKQPPEQRAVIYAAMEEMKESGILDTTIKVGDPLPDFTLKNAEGTDVNSDDLMARGPVILTFFRGHW